MKAGKEFAMYEKILVPMDGSDASDAGLNEAIKVAKLQGGTLRLLHVVERPEAVLDYSYGEPMSLNNVIGSLCQIGKRLLNEAETAAREQGLMPECVMCEADIGAVADVILAQARQWGANLIVMGSHARAEGVRVSKDSAKVLAESLVPVLLVHGTPVLTQHKDKRIPLPDLL
jgi:nucleotide-binding universal stress UspA family protein